MHLVVRVDAGPAIGLGHAMRMLALTQAARDVGHTVSIVAAELSPALCQRFAAEGAAVKNISAVIGSDDDVASTTDAAREADWLIVDGYRFVATYLNALSAHGAPWILAVDDCGHTAGATSLDLLLNPNVHASPALHPGLPRSCRLLLGSTYALLRRDFVRQRLAAPPAERATHFLVSCGGSDPAGITTSIARRLASLSGSWRATVVIGPAASPSAAVLGTLDGRIAVAVDVVDMAGLMATCDAAVAAAGGTALELACVGVPMALIAVADNQQPVARAFAEAGAAIDCGVLPMSEEALTKALSTLLDDGRTRLDLRRQAAALVDGAGARRVLEAVSALTLCLRPATMDDAAMLFAWANDIETRRWSFSSAPIAWEEHVGWMTKRCGEAPVTLFIAEDGKRVAIGTSRLVPKDGNAEISITVAPVARGAGVSARLIAATCRWAWRNTGYNRIRARIRPDNQYSLRAFRRSGFRDAGSSTAPDGSTCLVCSLERPAHA